MSLHVVILAAGNSRRMQSDLPKALVEVGGRPMLAHLLETARQLRPERFSVVIGREAEAIQNAFSGDDDVHWVLQETPLGTGHAVLCALRSFARGRTLVLYVDGPLVSIEALRALTESGEDLSVLAARADEPTGFGRMVMDSQGQLLKIVEEAHANEDQKRITEVNTGIMVGEGALMRELLDSMEPPSGKKEQYLTDIVALARQRNLSIGCVMSKPEDAALGANTLEELARLERTYQKRMSTALAEQGVRLADPARVQVRGKVHAAPGSFVDAGVLLEGEVELGEGVSIGPSVSIKDTRLGDAARVEANCVIEGAEIGPNCRVGPFARLRPGTRLGPEVHIGTFVEVKNAKLGARSKANHQAYLGDVEIGEDCNIGAGVITCNYDGAEKHKTKIGDRAFIGSNVTLIAPLTIENDAYVAAGSTLSKDVGEAELAVARGRQRNLKNWTPPGPNKKKDARS